MACPYLELIPFITDKIRKDCSLVGFFYVLWLDFVLFSDFLLIKVGQEMEESSSPEFLITQQSSFLLSREPKFYHLYY